MQRRLDIRSGVAEINHASEAVADPCAAANALTMRERRSTRNHIDFHLETPIQNTAREAQEYPRRGPEARPRRAKDVNEGIAQRGATPRREDYRIVPGSSGPRRDFRITVGLREGWDAEGRVYDVSEAVRTARAWMRRRVETGLPALSGMFTRAEVTYAWPRSDGSVGSDREPVAIFTGEAVHAYLGHLPDAEVEAMLNELAIELGAALGQERLYVAFCDRTWILDAGEREE